MIGIDISESAWICLAQDYPIAHLTMPGTYEDILFVAEKHIRTHQITKGQGQGCKACSLGRTCQGGVAHGIKNLDNGIINNTQILCKGTVNNNPRSPRELLSKIIQGDE